MRVLANFESRFPKRTSTSVLRSRLVEPLTPRNQPLENRCLMGRAKRAGITRATEGNHCMVLADRNWH
jgi:hypothetical protein